MTEEALATEQPLESSEIEAENTEVEETQQTEEAATSEGDQDSEKPKKHKGGFQRRIDQLTREKYEIQKERDRLLSESAQYQQALQQQALQQAGEIPMPKIADYGYDDEAYAQAIQQWHEAKVTAHAEQQQKQAQQQAEMARAQQRQVEFSAKLSDAVSKYPDFMVRVQDPQLPRLVDINPAALEVVVDSEKFADLSYYLANNPNELYGFHGLSRDQVVRKVAGLESKLSASTQQEGAPPPPPPKTVGGKGESAKDPAKMTTDEWIAWRNSKDPRLKR